MKITVLPFITLITAFSLLISGGCASDQKQTDPEQINHNKNIDTAKDNPGKDNQDDTISKEYLKEGFIDKSTFRIVIIATREECLSDQQAIDKKGRNRAMATLQKYLQSQGYVINQNTTTALLNIVNENGRFHRQNPECEKNNIYYFDIKKEGIRNCILDTCRRR